MEDRDFLDYMYQGWTKTTGAESMFWMPEQFEDMAGNKMPWYVIWAVDKDQHRHEVANDLTETDAAFITAVHGSFADLVRRMHTALDEADRLDTLADVRTGEIAELSIRVMELEQELRGLKGE